MTVSRVRRMLTKSKVEGGGSTVAVESMNASEAESPKEEGGGGGGGALKEDSTLGCLELALI